MAQSPSDDAPGAGAGSSAHGARAPRTNLPLSATIEAGALKAPVRIRNMSANGAMLDGAALPPVGAALTLRRADLDIGATVIWQRPSWVTTPSRPLWRAEVSSSLTQRAVSKPVRRTA